MADTTDPYAVKALPNEIQVWRNRDTLDHIGTWATTRYPPEAVTYVRKADAQAAVALVVEQAARDARDVFSDHKRAKESVDYMEQLIYSALADADGLAAVEALRKERDEALELARMALVEVRTVD